MVDSNKDNGDYQFVDMDTVSSDSTDTLQSFDNSSDNTFSKKIKSIQLDTRKKALIVILILIMSVFFYKILSSSSNKKQMASTGVSVVKESIKPAVMQPSVQPSPSIVTTNNVVINEEIERKLFQMKQNQETIHSHISAMNNQINVINTNMANLESKIESLAQTMGQLVERIKAKEIEQANVRTMIKSMPKSTAAIARKPSAPSLRYYIQAVIPGRAWLIATNGSTLTVSEGTMISGYGVVKLIDPRQGRVLTSSGQVIRFSPEDS